MEMSTELLTLTENYINRAFEEHDAPLLQKETVFLLNNYALNLSEAFSDMIDYVKPVNVKMRTDHDFMFQETYAASLKKMLSYSEQIMHHTVGLIEAKLFFDSWFYDVTKAGLLICSYNESEMVNIKEAANYLDVSRPTMYKYIERGLETVGEKNNQRIPRFILDAWKDPSIAFKLQWNYQMKKAREQTVEERLNRINRQIEEFEKEYAKPFHLLFGHLSDHEIDGFAEAVDIYDWKELELKKQELLEQLRG
jgi:hypothetical protein